MRIVAICLWLLLSCGIVSAQNKVVLQVEQDAVTGKVMHITHPAFGLKLEQMQGRVSFEYLQSNKIKFKAHGQNRLFLPVFSPSQMSKPESLPADFTLTHTQDSKTQITATLRCRLDEKWAGQELDGCVLTLDFIIDQAKPYLELVYSLHNPTDQLRYVSMGLSNCFSLDPHGNDRTYLPTTRHVLDISRSNLIFDYYSRLGQWEYEPTAGWFAVRNVNRQQGVVFLYDYNTLEGVYSSGPINTRGWMIDGGALPPGRSWQSRVKCVPFTGMTGVTHASDRLIADVRSTTQADRIRLDHYVMLLEQTQPVTIDAHVRSLLDQPLNANASTAKLKAAESPGYVQRGVSYLPVSTHDPLLTELTVSGEGWEESFRYYDENGQRTQPIPALELAVFQRTEMPSQNRKDVQVDPALLPQRRKQSVLLYDGVYTEHYHLDKALASWDIKTVNTPPARAEYFPSPLEMDQYSVMILSNVPANAMPGSFLRRMERFVDNGGSLLILGGSYAYGVGRYAHLGLDDWLPVKTHAFDLQKVENGTLQYLQSNLQFTVPPLDSDVKIYWAHQVQLRPEARILLATSDGQPVLVTSSKRKGKIACFLGTPLGKPKTNERSLWEWEQWPALVNELMTWLDAKGGQ